MNNLFNPIKHYILLFILLNSKIVYGKVWLEMASLGADAITEQMIKKSAKEALDIADEAVSKEVKEELAKVAKKSDDIIFKNVSLEDFSETFTATDEQYKIAYELWSNNKWDELYEYFKMNRINYDENIKDVWPPFFGSKNIQKIENGLQLKGKVFDRFQEGKYANQLGGRFASPVLNSTEGVEDLVFTYDSRALANKIKEGTYYYKFKIKDEVPGLFFEYGEAIPWFKLSGYADQVRSNLLLNDILNHIDIIEKLKYENG